MNSVDIDMRESMRCPKACGGMCPTPTEGQFPIGCQINPDSDFTVSENDLTRCTKCKAVVSATDAVLDAMRVGQQGLDKATVLQLKGLVISIK